MTMRYHLTPVRIKKRSNNKCWQECEKREFLCTVGGTVNWCGTLKNILVLSSKVKHALAYAPAIPFPHIYPTEILEYVYQDTCIRKFLTAKTWRQFKCPLLVDLLSE